MANSFGTLPNDAPNVEPFKIFIPEEELKAFRSLLELSPIPPLTYESSQEDRRYGVTTSWMMKAKDHWLNQFDWRGHEKHMNSFPNFIAHVEDEGEVFNVHFVALFSKKPGAIPVISCHGWPGSFLEFLPILSLATKEYTPETLPYHLIVPSLPGYAFSSGPPINDSTETPRVARILNTLMSNLNFSTGYLATGGDIGSFVSRLLASTYPSCKAMQINFCAMGQAPTSVSEDSLSEKDRQSIQRSKQFLATGSAYAMEHGTRTSTIGHVLSSSPLALLAWIGEKYLEWTDEDPSLDTILEAVSLYWFTNTISRCLYPYRQRFEGKNANHETPGMYVSKPFGFSAFPKELMPCPRAWAETTGKLTWYREHEKGGHFAAMERPREMKRDLEDFLGQLMETGVKFGG